ncbi:MAG: hypothetical protein B7Z59_09275 [Acidiphilium sp. 37-67-22]|nr:MAG: hypothetical protein B7Z76_02560 [Acidiphilium sp. 20-67-58]OYW08838.1 MAG: hypothetical protein B7Z59_09275 [Acidiphilium sp. 37-67-22]
MTLKTLLSTGFLKSKNNSCKRQSERTARRTDRDGTMPVAAIERQHRVCGDLRAAQPQRVFHAAWPGAAIATVHPPQMAKRRAGSARTARISPAKKSFNMEVQP